MGEGTGKDAHSGGYIPFRVCPGGGAESGQNQSSRRGSGAAGRLRGTDVHLVSPGIGVSAKLRRPGRIIMDPDIPKGQTGIRLELHIT